MTGSSPARISKIMGYGQADKAPAFDAGTVGSNPTIPTMIRYSRGLRGQPAKLLIVGSNPTRISNLVPSSNWSGRKLLKLVMLGSNPAGITIIIQGYSLTGRTAVPKTARGCSSRPIPANILGCRQMVKAPVSDTGICWFKSSHPSHIWRVNPEGPGTAR